MSKYKVITKDGSMFVSVRWGGYIGGEDNGFVFNTKKEALEAIEMCRFAFDDELILKEVA